ncbi:MAG: hypothetical protein AAFX95_16960, partial [Cyanobacteria bacterium J06639_16]
KDLTFAEAISLASPPVEPVQPSGPALTSEPDIAEPDIAEPDIAEPEEMDKALSEVDGDDLEAAAAEVADPVGLEETAEDDAIEVAEPEEILEEDEIEAAATEPELAAEPDDETEVAESEDPLEAAGPEDKVLAALELEDETTESSEIVVDEAAEDNPPSSDLADPDEMDATATAKPIEA